MEMIRGGVANVRWVPGRLQRIDSQGAQYAVFVDYAHTPDALRTALSELRKITAGRLICMFGCGGCRDRGKRPQMGRTVAELADLAVVTSDNPRDEDPRAIINQVLAGMDGQGPCRVTVDPDRRRAIFSAVRAAREGDTVLVAGKGHETYQMIGDTRLPFDDVFVASEAVHEQGAAV
jgi:UDP-N-acetylmuramoyl-L-alanyl-D-glutamate--2,6-diaminopimelate ligase